MKRQTFGFLTLLNIFLLLRIVAVLADEISEVIDVTSKQIDQAEREIFSEQANYKAAVNRTISAVQAAKNLTKNNRSLLKLQKLLDKLISILRNILKIGDFTLSDFKQKPGKDCKKVYAMISELEADLKMYLKLKQQYEDLAASITPQSDGLKLEYVATYIISNKTQNEAVLAVIAMSEGLVGSSKLFTAILYEDASKIANALYEIKVVRYKICDPSKSVQKTKATTKAKTLKASTSKKATTTVTRTTEESDEDGS